MNIALVYLFLASLLGLMSLAIMLNFLRYRFKGDKTLVFIALFFISFVIVAAYNLALFDYSSPPGDQFLQDDSF